LKCSDSLCNDCKKVHEKLSSTKDHEVVSLEQYDGNPSAHQTTTSYTTCNLHKRSCKLFCADCNVAICRKCAKEHCDHKYGKLSTLRREIEEKANSLLIEMKNRKDSYEKYEQIKRDKKPTLEKELKETRERIIELTEQHYRMLQQNFNQFYHESDRQVRVIHEGGYFENLQEKEIKLNDILVTEDFTQMIQKFDTLKKEVLNTLSVIPKLNNVEFKLGNIIDDLAVHGFGCLLLSDNIKSLFESETLTIIREMETDFRKIDFIQPLGTDTMWLADQKTEILQLVDYNHLTSNPINQISMIVSDGCVLNEQLFVTDKGYNKAIRIISMDGTIKTFKVFENAIPTCIYVCPTGEVFVGTMESSDYFSEKDCRIQKLSNAGDVKQEFEIDNRGIKLFKDPYRCCVNEINKNILVIDLISDKAGRLICMTEKGDIKFRYFGNMSLNLPEPFSPSSIACTNDTILVNDYNSNNGLHVLDIDGKFIHFLSYSYFEIDNPVSIAIDQHGQLLLGSVSYESNESRVKSKIYITKIQ
ncbi:uncharacterized protein LOC127702732, partial [Mytilus californianus]|uniref:uncharacterized protein LOC127702732 n=1 Tax=Mytilus californianus TaxID=6549 RepID=UPI0022452F4C